MLRLIKNEKIRDTLLRSSACVASLVLLSAGVLAAPPAKEAAFHFSYKLRITDLPAGKTVRVWTPLITTGPEQDVRRLSMQLPPQAAKIETSEDRRFRNRLVYFEAASDKELVLEIRYRVLRKAAAGRSLTNDEREMVDSHFLAPSELVPTDPLLRKQFAPNLPAPASNRKLARELYLAVNKHLTYGKPKGQPWGRGDARWACQSGTGNCTDYHSLFISACRSLQIPALFEIGFSIPDEPRGSVAGYHCWARFVDSDNRWLPVDISEGDKNPAMREYYFGNLTPHRVTVSIGRDLVLNPTAATKRVNYFVYPHVEIDDKVHQSFTPLFEFEQIIRE